MAKKKNHVNDALGAATAVATGINPILGLAVGAGNLLYNFFDQQSEEEKYKQEMDQLAADSRAEMERQQLRSPEAVERRGMMAAAEASGALGDIVTSGTQGSNADYGGGGIAAKIGAQKAAAGAGLTSQVAGMKQNAIHKGIMEQQGKSEGIHSAIQQGIENYDRRNYVMKDGKLPDNPLDLIAEGSLLLGTFDKLWSQKATSENEKTNETSTSDTSEFSSLLTDEPKRGEENATASSNPSEEAKQNLARYLAGKLPKTPADGKVQEIPSGDQFVEGNTLPPASSTAQGIKPLSSETLKPISFPVGDPSVYSSPPILWNAKTNEDYDPFDPKQKAEYYARRMREFARPPMIGAGGRIKNRIR